jgi:hypothetical protein
MFFISGIGSRAPKEKTPAGSRRYQGKLLRVCNCPEEQFYWRTTARIAETSGTLRP